VDEFLSQEPSAASPISADASCRKTIVASGSGPDDRDTRLLVEIRG
jgi:hypothetical protein